MGKPSKKGRMETVKMCELDCKTGQGWVHYNITWCKREHEVKAMQLQSGWLKFLLLTQIDEEPLVLQLQHLGITKGGYKSSLTTQEANSPHFKKKDALMVAVMPKPPAEHLCDYNDDDDDLKFHMPQSATWWKRKLFYLLRERLRLPDIVLVTVFSISLKAWAGIVLWFLLAPVAHRWDVGPLYILGTGFLVILLNLGKRQHGELSAYSIFNEDFRELPGTLNADRLDRDIRAGQF